jgi:NAD(P) transhydrogenase subunit alpha
LSPFILIGVFIAAFLLGYRIISNVPSLLHTPLMSGMNALAGVIILGALSATASAGTAWGVFLGAAGVALAITNVFGGFDVTHKMLRMVKGKNRTKAPGSGEPEEPEASAVAPEKKAAEQ